MISSTILFTKDNLGSTNPSVETPLKLRNLTCLYRWPSKNSAQRHYTRRWCRSLGTLTFLWGTLLSACSNFIIFWTNFCSSLSLGFPICIFCLFISCLQVGISGSSSLLPPFQCILWLLVFMTYLFFLLVCVHTCVHDVHGYTCHGICGGQRKMPLLVEPSC